MRAPVLDLVEEQSKWPKQKFVQCPMSSQNLFFKRGFLARDLAEEYSTALKQNPVRCPVHLSKIVCSPRRGLPLVLVVLVKESAHC